MPVKELIHGQTVYPQGRKIEVSSKHLEWTQEAARALTTHDALLKAARDIRDWTAGGDVPDKLFEALCTAITASDGTRRTADELNQSIVDGTRRTADELNQSIVDGAKTLAGHCQRIGPKHAGEPDYLRRPEDPEAVHLVMPSSDPERLSLGREFVCGLTWPRELWGNVRNVARYTDQIHLVTCLTCLQKSARKAAQK